MFSWDAFPRGLFPAGATLTADGDLTNAEIQAIIESPEDAVLADPSRPVELAAPHPEWPRIDLICRTPPAQQIRDGCYVDDYSLIVITGEASPEPVRPDPPMLCAPLAAITVPPARRPNRAERRKAGRP